jgi:hypothetical protein
VQDLIENPKAKPTLFDTIPCLREHLESWNHWFLSNAISMSQQNWMWLVCTNDCSNQICCRFQRLQRAVWNYETRLLGRYPLPLCLKA